jgi:hypothetical protein
VLIGHPVLECKILDSREVFQIVRDERQPESLRRGGDDEVAFADGMRLQGQADLGMHACCRCFEGDDRERRRQKGFNGEEALLSGLLLLSAPYRSSASVMAEISRSSGEWRLTRRVAGSRPRMTSTHVSVSSKYGIGGDYLCLLRPHNRASTASR